MSSSQTTYDRRRAEALLGLGTGLPGAAFREGQDEAIQHVVEGRGRLLLVRKTGWGKSFVYFIATKLLREAGHGPALLISPLLALMRNQIAAAERMGVRARTINSSNQDDWDDVEDAIRRGEVDLLLVSPERLANERFLSEVMGRVSERISLVVIDEAHCISDWGHDFRPHYRLLGRTVRVLPKNLRVLATTATANDRVVADLEDVLGPDLAVSRGELGRPSLMLQTIRLSGQVERLAWLADQVPQLPGHGIIYVLTVRDAEQVVAWLQSRGLAVAAYTGRTGDARPGLEQALLDNELKALVATTALGMGFDKPDLGFVIHYQMPGSVVAYYQQVGRAGRALEAAYGVLLGGDEDLEILEYFITSAFPSRDEVELVLSALEEDPEGLSLDGLQVRLNLRRGRIQKTVELLSLESPAPVVKDGTRWQLTAANLSDAFWERVERLTALRRSERQQMEEYLDLPAGHMEFLVRALDGSIEQHVPPPLPVLPIEPPAGLVREAAEYLRRTSVPFELRKRWPAGGIPASGLRGGTIARDHRAQPGRSLCVWGDAGWGRSVREGKFEQGRFADELVQACARLVGEWDPQPSPAWVTCVPSRRHSELVPDFARRLAGELGLPFHEVLDKTSDRPEQKQMANSIQQARNVDGSLSVVTSPLPEGPVLLVDDMVDSRWTLTVATWLLRSCGSAEVWPLTLAVAGKGA